MLHRTKYSSQLQPSEVRDFVAKTMKKPVLELGKFNDESIYFEVENTNFKTIGFVASDYCIECENKGIATQKLTKVWQVFMSEKFGKNYVQDYNKYNSKELQF